MKPGTLGILTNNVFKQSSTRTNEQKIVYLTTAIDVTNKYKKTSTNSNKIMFEAKWYMIEKYNFTCAALYLSELLTPDEVVVIGDDFKILSSNTNRWMYHKVLLFLNDKVEVVFIHEKNISLFTWFDTVKINFHEDGLNYSLP